MELLVEVEAFESITSPEATLQLRQAVGESMQRIEKSGKLVFGRVYVGARGGAFVLDVEDSQEAFDLLSPGIVDHCHTEIRPVVTLDDLGEFFQKDHARLAQQVEATA